ncbi:MAG: XRE family transcriptional regulator [Bacteroidetes bacterium]|nr:MAG: XRE family transcriptional regulator [Bacteroidota bacterium]
MANQKRINLISIRKKMLDKGLSQRDLAAHFGVDFTYVSHALAGRRKSLLGKIAAYVAEYRPVKKAA